MAPGQGSLDFFIKRKERAAAEGKPTQASPKKDGVPKIDNITDFKKYTEWF